jgi:hypothetical protein
MEGSRWYSKPFTSWLGHKRETGKIWILTMSFKDTRTHDWKTPIRPHLPILHRLEIKLL